MLVECVPNFSEGRDQSVIDAIAQAAAATDYVRVLDVDPGADTNRTVLTFVGPPEAVLEGAFRVIETAADLIDMRKHRGAHARHGAVDVCPFVPVSGVTMEDCAKLARTLGKRVGDELGIPVYLYEQAALRPERKNLAYVRQGEYEALPKKLADPHWAPDFGPAQWNDQAARTGVVTIGAREFLVAYNINLNTRDKRHAIDIAFAIRKKGRSVRRGNIHPHYFRGEILRYSPSKRILPCGMCHEIAETTDTLRQHYRAKHDFNWPVFLKLWNQPIDGLEGRPVKAPGLFDHCKATGWVIEEYGCAQITMNLTNIYATPVHEVLEACRRLAHERGLVVTGSEIVGLVPFQALYDAGLYYIDRYGGPKGLPWRDILDVAVRSMGFSEVAPFEIEKKVIGLPERPARCLMSLSARDFVDEVSRESPAPGGGSVAALAGALGAALAGMVANLTVGKEGYEEVYGELNEVALKTQAIQQKLSGAVDTDTEAFNSVLEAMRLPSGGPEQKERRRRAIQEGYKAASKVPLETAKLCLQALELALIVVKKGNTASITDGGVAALMACAGVEGAVYNVRVNLPSIRDEEFRAMMAEELNDLVQKARQLRDDIDQRVSDSSR